MSRRKVPLRAVCGFHSRRHPSRRTQQTRKTQTTFTRHTNFRRALTAILAFHRHHHSLLHHPHLHPFRLRPSLDPQTPIYLQMATYAQLAIHLTTHQTQSRWLAIYTPPSPLLSPLSQSLQAFPPFTQTHFTQTPRAYCLAGPPQIHQSVL